MSIFSVALLIVIVGAVVVGLACDCRREWKKWNDYNNLQTKLHKRHDFGAK